MKRLIVVSLVALASLALVPSALSDPPTIVRTPIDETLFDDVDCGFPVQIHIVGTELAVLRGEDRAFFAFPNSRATLTNLVTGRTLTVSTAAPATTLSARTEASRSWAQDPPSSSSSFKAIPVSHCSRAGLSTRSMRRETRRSAPSEGLAISARSSRANAASPSCHGPGASSPVGPCGRSSVVAALLLAVPTSADWL